MAAAVAPCTVQTEEAGKASSRQHARFVRHRSPVNAPTLNARSKFKNNKNNNNDSGDMLQFTFMI